MSNYGKVLGYVVTTISEKGSVRIHYLDSIPAVEKALKFFLYHGVTTILLHTRISVGKRIYEAKGISTHFEKDALIKKIQCHCGNKFWTLEHDRIISCSSCGS